MGVKAVNYCISDNDTFSSMQLIVGDSDVSINLRKHGEAGGECRQWRLQAEDYIRTVQYTWNRSSGRVTAVVFQTHMEQTRVIGRGEGFKVNYDYNAFQPFVGLFTFEVGDATMAIGAYEDDCHNTPAKLPFGFETMNVPSMDAAKGEDVMSSVTWVNERHGTTVDEEAMMLD